MKEGRWLRRIGRLGLAGCFGFLLAGCSGQSYVALADWRAPDGGADGPSGFDGDAWMSDGGSVTAIFQPGPTDGKDAAILSGASPDISNDNYETGIRLEGYAWTWSSVPVYGRSLLEFDLSQIPETAVVESATLSLYASPETDSNVPGHSELSGANDFLLLRVVEPWDERTVTWATQPATTSDGQVLIPGTSVFDADFVGTNVTPLVQSCLSNRANCHGFMLRLVTEEYYRKVLFASSDDANPARRPMLVVVYRTR